jgi:uncharacterized protein YceK
MRRALRPLFTAVTTLLGLAGCAAIVGIDDNTLGAPASKACQDYCSKAMTGCTGAFALYSKPEACLGVCAKLPPGDDLEPAGNTVACRSKQAGLAVTTMEPAPYCPAAGPGGAGVCGENCDSYCSLLQQTCPKEFGMNPDCLHACSTLKDTGKFNLDADHTGDTIQCRLEHVSNATAQPATHCPHAAIVSSEYCVAPADLPPDCAEFCRFNSEGCAADMSVYESTEQCMAVCRTLPAGTNGDREENTMGCRRWHTYNSLLDPASHCPHTSPSGDGHCGLDAPDKTGNCVSYCTLAEAACGTKGFDTKYGTQSACQVDCSTQPDAFGAKHDSKYKPSTAASGNTVQCRILHAARALTDMSKAAAECPSVLGQGSCQ